MKTLLASLAATVLLAGLADAQVTCYRLGQYTTCNGPDRQSTTLTELSPSRGIITTDRDAQPYTLYPSVQPNRSRDLDHALDSLDSLDRLDGMRYDDDPLQSFLPLGLSLE